MLVIKAPHMQNVVKGRERVFADGIKKIEIVRISPYPPSFSNMAARIIEPAIGASTWALGSHRWKP